MSKIFSRKKKIKRAGILYIVVSISILLILMPYLLPIHLKEIPISTLLYDRNNIVIGEILPDTIHRHQILDFDMYPQFLVNTIIAIEDKRFRTHNGIDIIALTRATRANIKSQMVVQ